MRSRTVSLAVGMVLCTTAYALAMTPGGGGGSPPKDPPTAPSGGTPVPPPPPPGGSSLTALDHIQRFGTAGMQLPGGAAILVQQGRVMVQTGKVLMPLVPAGLAFLHGKNTSGFQTAALASSIESQARAQFPELAARSFKVLTAARTLSSGPEGSKVAVHLVFQDSSSWLAEERGLELLVKPQAGALKLQSARKLDAQAALEPDPWERRFDRATGKFQKLIGGRPMPDDPFGVPSPKAAPMALAKLRGLQLKPISQVAVTPEFKLFPIFGLIGKLGPLVVLGPSARGLANTAYPEVVTAAAATDQVHAIFQATLGASDKLIGAASSKDAVLNYLKNGQQLVAWNNIGHGNTGTIFEGATAIAWNDLLPTPDRIFPGLNGTVCLVNSCQTFNNPLKAAILHHAPRVYIAGIVNLPMVSSEGSNPNFWYKTLIQHKAMSVAFAETNAGSGLTGYWGYYGATGAF